MNENNIIDKKDIDFKIKIYQIKFTKIGVTNIIKTNRGKRYNY